MLIAILILAYFLVGALVVRLGALISDEFSYVVCGDAASSMLMVLMWPIVTGVALFLAVGWLVMPKGKGERWN